MKNCDDLCFVGKTRVKLAIVGGNVTLEITKEQVKNDQVEKLDKKLMGNISWSCIWRVKAKII